MVGALSGQACYNDSDTYLTELRDNLDVTNAIIGRFTLYPPPYYEKRIEIQKEILKRDPNNLDAYDNISVAYDRIGKGEEALKWIREKRKHLNANSPKLHLYSTEANEGTFLIVRWIRGHKQGDVTDALASEKLISKALEINPDAHFGREFAQLYCIRAMIQSANDGDWTKVFTQRLIAIAKKDQLSGEKLRYGICGMMVLGAAWNMPALIQAIGELVPDEPQFANLCRAKLRHLQIESPDIDLVKEYPISVKAETRGMDSMTLHDLVKNGAEFRASQDAWVIQQVANGLHPDKGDDIWKGYQEVPPIPKEKLANSTIFSRAQTFLLNTTLATAGCCVVVPLGGFAWGISLYRRRKRGW